MCIRDSLFHFPSRELAVMVHGDDFFATGLQDQVEWYEQKMRDLYEVKCKGVGWAGGMGRELTILGRVLRLDDEGATLEADPALLDECMSALDLEGAKAVVAPVVKGEYFGAATAAEILQRRLRGEDKMAAGCRTPRICRPWLRLSTRTTRRGAFRAWGRRTSPLGARKRRSM